MSTKVSISRNYSGVPTVYEVNSYSARYEEIPTRYMFTFRSEQNARRFVAACVEVGAVPSECEFNVFTTPE